MNPHSVSNQTRSKKGPDYLLIIAALAAEMISRWLAFLGMISKMKLAAIKASRPGAPAVERRPIGAIGPRSMTVFDSFLEFGAPCPILVPRLGAGA